MRLRTTAFALLGLALLLGAFSIASLAHAESVQWNQNLISDYESAVIAVVLHTKMILSNPGITLNYYGHAFLVDESGNKLRPLVSGDTLTAGDRVLFEFGPHQNSDISWYASGSAWGTPYGYWRDGASDPGGSNIIASPAPKSAAPTCNANVADKYATRAVIEDEHYVPGCKVDGPSCSTNLIGGYGDLYAAYSVAPPGKSVSTSGGAWSGCTDAGSGNKICTVDSNGVTASAALVFASTQSRFYGDMVYEFTNKNFRANDGGQHSGCLNMGKLGSSITVPEQRIEYTFNVEGVPGGPPTTPTLPSGGACVVGTPHSISFVSTDPDGDNVRYGVDWDADGSVNEWVPPSGYVASGASQSASRTYSTTGSKTVKVMAEDEGGLTSAWATLTFSCTQTPPPTNQCSDNADNDGDGLIDSLDPDCTTSDGFSEFPPGQPPPPPPPPPPPDAVLELRAIPSLVRRGNTTQIHWSAQNVQSCTVAGDNGDSWSGTASPVGGRTSRPITGETKYTLSCVDLEGDIHVKMAKVHILFNEKEE